MTNIFFNNDTLVLSLPLIVLCSFYAFVKLVPLVIGIPLIGVAILVYQMHVKIKRRRAEQSLTKVMDESLVEELEVEGKEKQQKKAAKKAKKDKKASDKLRQRLKDEKKAEQQNGGGAKVAQEEEELDDDAAMLTFAKGGRASTKKKR